MQFRLPIKLLARYSLVLSAAITVFIFIITYMQDLDHYASIFRAVVGGLVFSVNAAISILLIILLEKKYSSRIIDHTRLRFVLGMLINTTLMVVSHGLRENFQELGGITLTLYDRDDILMFGQWQIYLLIFTSSTLVYSLVYLLHNFLLINHLKAETDREVAMLRSVNAESTILLLRQQIQPHFLFNALNVLKSLIRKDPQLAETYLVRLSDFLRTSFAQNKKGIATLKEEVKLCQDYLEMQKIRFGDALEYHFTLPERFSNCTLPFFSLQTLAENAIKHNQLTDENPLKIRVRVDNGEVEVTNNLQKKSFVESSTGSGLSNLSERYQLLTGEQLKIVDDGSWFTVSLKTLKHENSNH